MPPTEENFYLNWSVSPKAFGVAILALLILVSVGFTPTPGSVATQSTTGSAVALIVPDAHQETGESSSTKCVIHIACVAIEASSPSVSPTEFVGAKHPLSLVTSVLRATGPPLLHPPIIS